MRSREFFEVLEMQGVEAATCSYWPLVDILRLENKYLREAILNTRAAIQTLREEVDRYSPREQNPGLEESYQCEKT